LPALEKINPMVKEALNTLSEVAQSDEAIIQEYLCSIKEKVFCDYKIVIDEYKKLSKQVKLRLVYEYLQDFNLDYDYKKINEVYDFIEQNCEKRNGTTLSLTSGLWLYVDEKQVETIPNRNADAKIEYRKEYLIDGAGEYQISERRFIIKPYEPKEIFIFPEATANFVYVDLSNIKMPLTLRHRKDGDVINPFGMSGTMKLKKYFNSKGVNRHKRDDVLLLTKDDDVLWAVGVGLSNKIGVKYSPTHVIEVL
jgi:tRNA(Ile)-lysidine synthase